jgi:hypothetical protein
VVVLNRFGNVFVLVLGDFSWFAAIERADNAEQWVIGWPSSGA